MKKSHLKTLALAALLAASIPVQAQMYKCVDERGVTSYSDSPRAGCKGKEVDIRPIPPVSGELKPDTSDLAGREADFRRRQIERSDAQADEDAGRKQECEPLQIEVGHAKIDSRFPGDSFLDGLHQAIQLRSGALGFTVEAQRE